MFKKAITATFALAISLGFTQTASAAETSAAPATVIVYRAEETVRTKRLDLDLTVNDMSLGKLEKEDVMVSQGPAGQYTLGTSMPGTEPLTLDLKPGATYYVHTRMELRGGRVYVSMTEVAEQVARVQNPLLDGAI